MSDEEDEYLRAIAEALTAQEQARRAVRESVARARANGRSWTVIAMVLRVSKQAARERFGRNEPIPPPPLRAAPWRAQAATGPDDLDTLSLPVPVANALRRAGISTVAQAETVTGPDQVDGIGKAKYAALRTCLEQR